jgi:predicted nucleotidyltransferase
MFDKQRHENGPVEADLKALAAALSGIDEIEFAWLFGSRATGRARRNSDVDLAIGLRGGVELELMSDLHERIVAAIDAIVPSERVDLIALTEKTPTALRHQVFKHGHLLFAKDRERLVHLRYLTARDWGDSEPKRREAWAITKQRILER